MKIGYILIIVIITFMMNLSMAQDYQKPSHHTDHGFRNPYPGFEEHNFTDFLQWQIVDRIKGKKPDKPDSYSFEKVENDGSFLRNNSEEFTVTWIGHSTLLIQLDGLNILTDPIWSDRSSPVQFAGPKRHVEPGLDFEDLPEIDIVIISHNHYDHLDRLTIEKLGNKPKYFVPLGIGEFLSDLDISNYEELDWWDSITFNKVKFVCTPSQHFSNRTMFDRNKTLWCSWTILGHNFKFYFGGDSGYFPGFKEIAKKYGPFDIAALPIGAYLPRWFMSPVHLSPQEAIQSYLDLKAEVFIPIHWGTFELADEPLDLPPKVLKEEIEKRQLNSDKFWILKHGETKIYQSHKVAAISVEE